MMNIHDLEYGAIKYDTPLYIFDIDDVKKTVTGFKEKLGSDADICFAMKANPFLTRQISKIVERIEVCSYGEYKICKTLEVDPEKILISGVMKEKDEILEILNYYKGKCVYTIESPNQFYCLADWSEENREVVNVYLRLTSGNQFGMDEEKIRQLMIVSKEYPFLKIKGIHYFSGTQKKSAERVKKELLYLDNICKELSDIEELEYGPGIPVSYFQDREINENKFVAVIHETTNMMEWKGRITLEMGRALTASCGYYLTEIKDIKKNSKKNYCIVNGGIHQLQYDGQIRGMYTPKFQILRKNAYGDEHEWTICGSLCTVNDVLIQNVKIKGDLREGDIIVFEMAGAYAPMEGMSLFLSHELPTVSFYDKESGWKLIRSKQPTYQLNME